MNTFEPSLRVLLVEAYAGASHQRVNHLLKRHSRHHIEIVEAGRDHWKQLALLSHFELAEQVSDAFTNDVPDVLLFSGAMNIPGFLALLPEALRRLPSIAYFHESQWNYPTLTEDTRPFLVQHLDAVLAASEVWFNSRFHRNTFWSAATNSNVDARIRQLARRIQGSDARLEHVVYPPVALDSNPDPNQSTGQSRRILWNARWELDKRPDRFIAMLHKLSAEGHTPDIQVMGTGGRLPEEIAAALESTGLRVQIPGHLPDRNAYESGLCGGGVVVSTADHEFFGIAMLEAVLSGCTPVLPAALAYPETLPSAWFYCHGDLDDLVRIVGHVLDAGPGLKEMHAADAGRFLPERAVLAWDDGIMRVWRHNASDR